MRKIEDIKILVVGDIMLDHYIEGEVTKISAEAPVPIVDVIRQYSVLGGCGNVIRNLRSIGVNVDCITSVGRDVNGRKIIKLLHDIGIEKNIYLNSMQTTTKTRIISNDRQIQMLRYDEEIIGDIELPIKSIDDNYDIIIVSDYAKGVITEDLMEILRRTNVKIIVDPKPKNITLYKGIHAITPNKKEFDAMGIGITFYSVIGNIKNIIKTLGKDGIVIFEINEDKTITDHYIKSNPVDVYNVSGAGDTVVAILSACISMGYDIVTSSRIANQCAGWAVTQSGTTAVPKEIFNTAITRET